MEHQPWVARRSSRHDEICAAVAARPERLFHGFTGEVRATIEAPCGPGFIDVLAVTVAPANEVRRCIVEVKTNDERCSAGDVIRQLKWYRQRLGCFAELVLVVEDAGGVPSAMLDLLLHERVEVLPVSFFTRQEAA